jgi:hypothetical protein
MLHFKKENATFQKFQGENYSLPWNFWFKNESLGNKGICTFLILSLTLQHIVRPEVAKAII